MPSSTYYGEEEMLAVLETLALSDEAMFVIDDRQRIVFWNQGMQQLLGFTHDQVAGRTCCSALAGTDSFGNRYCSGKCPVVGIAVKGDTVRPYRLSYRSRMGEFVPLEISVVRFTLRVSKRLLLAHVARPIETPMMAVVEATAPVVRSEVRVDARARQLTTREMDILERLARGQSARIVAQELGISPITARNHLHHLFKKLEVHSRSEAVALAYRMKLV